MKLPKLKMQELPLDDTESKFMFRPDADKPLVATTAAVKMYQLATIVKCLAILQAHAVANDGLDYLQVFTDETKPENLWFIEDGDGGAITALLPSDY